MRAQLSHTTLQRSSAAERRPPTLCLPSEPRHRVGRPSRLDAAMTAVSVIRPSCRRLQARNPHRSVLSRLRWWRRSPCTTYDVPRVHNIFHPSPGTQKSHRAESDVVGLGCKLPGATSPHDGSICRACLSENAGASTPMPSIDLSTRVVKPRPTQQSLARCCANSNTIPLDRWPLWDYNRLVMNKEHRTIKLRSYVTRPFYKAVRERAWQERLSMSALIQVWIQRGLDGPAVSKEERS